MALTPMRAATLQLLLSVVVLDAAFIAVHFVAGMRTAAPSTRIMFTVVWMAATLIVVLVGLARVRRARGGPR